jgi:hypothetical protein
VVGQQYFRMDNAALFREIVCLAVKVIFDFFPRPVSRRRDSRFTFAPADYLYAQMIVCHDVPPCLLIQKRKLVTAVTA